MRAWNARPGGASLLRVKGLGELEAAVMDRMWAADRPMTVREVLTEVNTTRDLAYTTVMTVLDNLHKKDWLRREMVSRAWVYSPVATLEQYSAQLMESALNASSDSVATLVHFVQAMGQDEIEALQAALREAKTPRAGTASGGDGHAGRPHAETTGAAARPSRARKEPS